MKIGAVYYTDRPDFLYSNLDHERFPAYSHTIPAGKSQFVYWIIPSFIRRIRVSLVVSGLCVTMTTVVPDA